MTGTDLKLRRVAAHVKAKDIAERAGMSPWQTSRLEGPGTPDPERAQRYLAALDELIAERDAKLATLATNTTTGNAA